MQQIFKSETNGRAITKHRAFNQCYMDLKLPLLTGF